MSSKEPSMEGVSAEIENYIEKLKEENNDKEKTLNNLKTEMKSQLSCKMDLEMRLEKCFHLIIFLRSTIYQLDSDDFNTPNESPDRSEIQKVITNFKEEIRSWRVKAKTSNLECAILRSEVDELKEKIAEYENKNEGKETLNLARLNGNGSMRLQSTEKNYEQNRTSRHHTRRRKRRKK